ncbi:MAG: hypothetical protein HY658_10830 [Actinobacteria bacterium]|nr:hypothetical protein [Actinomycetota bacterium]
MVEEEVVGIDLREVQVAKHDRTFLLSDGRGDVRGTDPTDGLYHRGVRFLSRLELLLDGRSPVLLHGSTESGHSQEVELAWPGDGAREAPGGHVTVSRQRVVGETVMERVRLTAYGPAARDVGVEVLFEADFREVLDSRSIAPAGGGQPQRSRVERNQVVLSHRGRDGAARSTVIRFSPMPEDLSAGRAAFRLHLEPRAPVELGMEVIPAVGEASPARRPIEESRAAVDRAHARWRRRCTRFRSSDPGFQRILERSIRDLRMLQSADRAGEPFLEAGVPWFGALLGRDALIAAYECLGVNPDVAWSTLRRLADLQGERDAPEHGEEPGRIPHRGRSADVGSTRTDADPERPAGGEPDGALDTTPLWLVVLGAAHAWTGDLDAVRELWPNALGALEWIDRWGDADGDGYVEGRPGPASGGGWRDAPGAVAHPDGTPVSGPVALVEVQAYVYAARRAAAGLARALGDAGAAEGLDRAADGLRDRFAADFWIEDLGFPALALDGDKRPVATPASNAGHALWCRILEGERAAATARTLLSRSLACGWGVRTLSSSHPLFDPLGRHGGAVWPHDSALIAHGLRRAGLHRESLSLVDQVAAAGSRSPLGRYPEMFCGFGAEDVEAPVEHPEACRPHAVAAGAPLLLVRSFCGLSADAAQGVLWVVRPELPTWLEQLEVVGMRVGAARVDLTFSRRADATAVHVPRKEGEVDVLVRQ